MVRGRRRLTGLPAVGTKTLSNTEKASGPESRTMAMAQGILPLEQAAMVLAMDIPPENQFIFYHTTIYLLLEWLLQLLFVKKTL